MAKTKSFPKAPKAKASEAVWAKYEKKCLEVKKHNDEVAKQAASKQKVKDRVAKIKGK